jgi:RNA polymerase sigma-70 factor (ECF subfamily)
MEPLRDPDRALVERFTKFGSHEAFREIYDRYRHKVFGTSYHIIGDSTEAADVTQEVFLRVYRKLPGFRFESSFGSWLYRLTINLATDMRRKAQVRKTDSLATLADPVEADMTRPGVSRDEHPPEAGLVREEVQAEVKRALAKLSERLRVVVVLRYLEGLSYDQIAKVVGTPVGTVKSRLNRAHERLQEILSELAEQ